MFSVYCNYLLPIFTTSVQHYMPMTAVVSHRQRHPALRIDTLYQRDDKYYSNLTVLYFRTRNMRFLSKRVLLVLVSSLRSASWTENNYENRFEFWTKYFFYVLRSFFFQFFIIFKRHFLILKNFLFFSII